ncbi:site-specific integrase [Haliea atlantica]
MLEHYFIRPQTVDRVRNAWLGEPIEQYVAWLHENNYAARNVHSRVPLLMKFGEFAQSHGASSWDQLPDYVDGFVADWVQKHSRWCRNAADRRCVENAARNPLMQLIRLILPGHTLHTRQTMPDPFTVSVTGFFSYLQQERGLQETTISQYRHFLRLFEHYLERLELTELHALSIPVVSGFITESSGHLGKDGLRYTVGVLRVFCGYLYRERLITEKLAVSIEAPQRYRLANVPRSISWAEVRCLLESVDRRSAVGKRDYALLLLLVTYGLRAKEVAALTLDSIDWKRERLLVPERKAGHNTAYPLSPVVGEAIIDYIRNGRPASQGRDLFFRAMAPYRPLAWSAISQRVTHHLRHAGIHVHRAGAHTLRHTCVQRLVDAEFPLKTIGDYVGHRSPEATEVYTKVAIETLRAVALGEGESVL